MKIFSQCFVKNTRRGVVDSKRVFKRVLDSSQQAKSVRQAVARTGRFTKMGPLFLYLLAGSPKGAAANAGIYTLVETVKANGLDAMKYIKYILSDMPGSTFLENPEYLNDYPPWDPMVQEQCR